jgi:L-histidine N-alpha-methyltransferase
VSFRLERRLGANELAEQLRREAREGLTASPKFMRSRWVWDARGAELYDRIMELPQYYLPQVERPLLAAHAGDVEALVHPVRAVELGPGSSVKTPLVLDPLAELERYVAIDVSEEALEAAGRRLAERYPELDILGIIGDFESGLPEPAERTLVVCLGSTVGNMGPRERATLFTNVARIVDEDGGLLLGLDLVKDPERIAGAYRDDLGYTDGLISNLLPILNRELGADFDVARFRPEAEWVPERSRMEMYVRALEPQTVRVRELDLTVEFAEGERLRTEISTKFTRDGAEEELAVAGLRITGWWTDEAGEFALCLAQQA